MLPLREHSLGYAQRWHCFWHSSPWLFLSQTTLINFTDCRLIALLFSTVFKGINCFTDWSDQIQSPLKVYFPRSVFEIYSDPRKFLPSCLFCIFSPTNQQVYSLALISNEFVSLHPIALHHNQFRRAPLLLNNSTLLQMMSVPLGRDWKVCFMACFFPEVESLKEGSDAEGKDNECFSLSDILI